MPTLNDWEITDGPLSEGIDAKKLLLLCQKDMWVQLEKKPRRSWSLGLVAQ